MLLKSKISPYKDKEMTINLYYDDQAEQYIVTTSLDVSEKTAGKRVSITPGPKFFTSKIDAEIYFKFQ